MSFQIFIKILTILGLVQSYGTDESQCQQSEIRDIEGVDFIIGGLFPLHVQQEGGYTFYKHGLIWAQSMIFAIEEINNSTDILPNKKLGYRIFDSCGSIDQTLRNALLMMNGRRTQNDNRTCICENSNHTIIGLVGSAFSDTTISLASMLGASQTPLISYSATSTKLSDPKSYPSFLRTVAPDNFQTFVMADLLRTFQWWYINVIACDDAYGRVGVHDLLPVLRKENICLGVYEVFDPLNKTLTSEVIRKIKEEKQATVTILWCLRSEALQVKTAQDMKVYHRTWIATEAYGNSAELLKLDHRVTSGLLGIIETRHDYPGLVKHLTSITPNNTKIENPWLKEYWEDHGLVGNATNGTSSLDRLPRNQYVNVITSVYSIAEGLNQCILANKNNKPSPKDILPFIKKLNFTSKANTTVSFDKKGDPKHASYSLTNIQHENRKLLFKTVGLWTSKTRAIELKSPIQFANHSDRIPSSSCGEECKLGFIRVSYGHKPCCWKCLQCPIDHRELNNSCIPCQKYQISNADRTGCLDAKRVWLEPSTLIGYVIITMMAISYLTVTIVAAIFIKNRHTPIVKASNRGLTALQIISMLCQLSLPVLFMQETERCVVNLFSFTTFYTISVSVTFTKVDRLLRVFEESKSGILAKHNTMKGNLIQYLTVLFLTVIGCSLCQIMRSVDPIESEVTENEKSELILIQCGGSFQQVAFSVMVYIALIGLVCTVYAFKARKLPKFYSETRCTGFAMFTFMLTYTMGVPIYLSQSEQSDRLAVWCLLTIVSTMVMFFIIYVPKCHIIICKAEQNTRENFRQNLRELFNKNLSYQQRIN
ncbi:metabotropic glutamate receptor 3-like [Clytia hemisphaerica]|uniref:metabotropic glutamate receptor 3-like n=1 Tax=Clytia hemisphaerica TaxID=252671 RepID=UPI0034D420E2